MNHPKQLKYGVVKPKREQKPLVQRGRRCHFLVCNQCSGAGLHKRECGNYRTRFNAQFLKPHTCPACGQAFNKSRGLNQHLKLAHKVPAWQVRPILEGKVA